MPRRRLKGVLPEGQPLLRIVHYNLSLAGGAATAAIRLHDGLLRAGVESRFVYLNGTPRDGGFFPGASLESAGAKGWLLHKFKRIEYRLAKFRAGKGFELFSTPYSTFAFRGCSELGEPDIVHLHWIAGMFGWRQFFSALGLFTPVVFTLHDMFPFTGGCHYSHGCERFATGCGNCPQLGVSRDGDVSSKYFREKREAVEDVELHVVADSKWIELQARRSAIFAGARSIQTIYYGLDTSVFSPRGRIAARAQLGIDPGRLAVAFGADGVENPRKGFGVLLAAVEMLLKRGHKPLLLVFGQGRIEGLSSSVAESIIHFGSVAEAHRLSLIYSAADFFVFPSLEEAFGQVALEAMACGIPVVGFATGGIPELVEAGLTGFLSETGSVSDLAEKMETMLVREEMRLAMGERSRRVVESRFKLSDQAQNYMELYERILRPSP